MGEIVGNILFWEKAGGQKKMGKALPAHLFI